jgi:TonB family protein
VDYPHGAVMLLLFIDQEGKLENTSVVCANPAFEESALASIRDMRFSPAWDANGPVKSYMVVEFSYGTGAPCGPLPHNLKLN